MTAFAVAPGGRAVAAELCPHDSRPNESATLWLNARGTLLARRPLALGDVRVGALAVVGDDLLVAGSATNHEGRPRPQVLGRPLPPPHQEEMGFVARASATGAPRWIRAFAHEVKALLADPHSGDLLVAGRTTMEYTVAGRTVTPNLWVARLTGDGATQWTQTFGAEGSDGVRALAMGPSGEVYIAAGVQEPEAQPGLCTRCTLVARIESDGRVAWQQRFDDATAVTRATGIAVGPDGAVWVAGSFKHTLSVAGSTLTVRACPYAGRYPADVFLWRFAPNGTPVDALALGTCDADVDARVVVDARNRVLVAGAARVPPHAEAPPGDGLTAFVARLDP